MNKITEALEKTSELHSKLIKLLNDELKTCWIINQFDCTKHLTDDEFETLQGLIKKVQLKESIINQ